MNLDNQDGSIKKLFGIKDPVVKHDFVEENQNIIATAQNYHGDPSDTDLGLDDSHKSHLLVFDPTLGDLPTNVESANVIANAIAAPHDKKTQDKLIASHHDEVASGA